PAPSLPPFPSTTLFRPGVACCDSVAFSGIFRARRGVRRRSCKEAFGEGKADGVLAFPVREPPVHIAPFWHDLKVDGVWYEFGARSEEHTSELQSRENLV